MRAADKSSISDWDSLSEKMQDDIVNYLIDKLSVNDPELLTEVQTLIKKDPLDWWAATTSINFDGMTIPCNFHFGAGIHVRNILRGLYTDDQLPSGNWDDYYIDALEECAKRC